MACQEHIEKLRKGVDAWNKWRKDNPGSTPDFSKTNFYDLCMKLNLLTQDMQLRNERVNLRGMDFHNSVLDEADFTRFDLAKANFREAKLKNADFYDADLTGAELTYADLARTNFSNTVLIGANLAGAELWKANLFPENKAVPCQHQVKQLSVKTIDGLLKGIRRIKKLYKDYPGNLSFYFRGESETTWELRPSVMRDNFAEYESDMLRELISRSPEEFYGMTSTLSQWVLGQHHKLRTRFLDVTQNPLAALFFACENMKGKDGCLHIFAVPDFLVKPFNSDTVSIITNFAKLSYYDQTLLLGKRKGKGDYNYSSPFDLRKRYPEAMRLLYQSIRQEKPYFDKLIEPRDFYRVIVVKPQLFLERIRAQSGAFLVSAFHERFEREKILEYNKETPVYAHYKLIVSSQHKADIIKELESLNITRETLFPGLDSSAEAITARYNSPSTGQDVQV